MNATSGGAARGRLLTYAGIGLLRLQWPTWRARIKIIRDACLMDSYWSTMCRTLNIFTFRHC